MDCNDTDPLINPSAADDTYDGIDNDCDGLIDEDATVPVYDNDGDGSFSVFDCDDNDPTSYPEPRSIVMLWTMIVMGPLINLVSLPKLMLAL